LLRTARELLDADVPARRIQESIDALREQLPVGRPLSAVTISALGDRVLVKDEDAMWEPDSGQIPIAFDGSDIIAEPTHVGREPNRSLGSGAEESPGPTADDFYDMALDLEVDDPAEAITAYLGALALDPDHSDAHLNLGRLLHEDGRVGDAERHYRLASAADPTSARALYNLGVALEDQGAPADAIESYEAALGLDTGLGAAHFNLSRLYESGGRQADALQHLAAYRQLIASGTDDR
jgi:tetratricopeptide (TPR) repeat protein